MALEIDYDNLTIEEMDELAKNLEAFRNSKRKQFLVQARAEIQAVADKYKFSVEEIMAVRFAKSSKSANTIAPKYRDTEIGSRTWTGRGRKPVWVQDAQDRGVTLEQMLIVDNEDHNA